MNRCKVIYFVHPIPSESSTRRHLSSLILFSVSMFSLIWYTLFCTLDIIIGTGTRVLKKFHFSSYIYQIHYFPLIPRCQNFSLPMFHNHKANA